ncbi:MAG: hydrogenase maturation protease [Phycisphaeraceae bacterium]
MDEPRILIAGIGNIFLGDDAFGVEVVQRLARRTLPVEARVVDFGIRGLDLGFALLDGYETVILIDAVARGGAPGTLYVLEPEPEPIDDPQPEDLLIETHNMDPARVLRFAAAMGAPVRRVLLIGCEPRPPDSAQDMPMQLSPEMRAAVDEAVALTESMLVEIDPLSRQRCRT